MARASMSVTLGNGFGDGTYLSSGMLTTPITTPIAAVEAAVATLEADGASPTQAHVTALRAAWNTLVTASTAGDLTLNYDTTSIAVRNAFAGVLREAVQIYSASVAT